MFALVPPTAFLDNQSNLTAATLNTWRVNLSRAIDGTGGSASIAYVPSTPIIIGGAGLQLVDGLAYTSGDVTRHFAFNATTSASSNWSRANTPRGAWQNTASGGTLDIALEGLPHGNVLSSITLRWIGAAGHAAFPGGAPTMPSIQLWRINDDGTETSLGSQADTSTTAGFYEDEHDITLSGIAHTIDRTLYRYVLTVTGETGGNFIANAKALKCKGVVTVTAQNKW